MRIISPAQQAEMFWDIPDVMFGHRFYPFYWIRSVRGAGQRAAFCKKQAEASR